MTCLSPSSKKKHSYEQCTMISHHAIMDAPSLMKSHFGQRNFLPCKIYGSYLKYFEILPNWNINNSRTYHTTAMKLDLFGLVMSRVCPIQVRHQGPIINCHSQPQLGPDDIFPATAKEYACHCIGDNTHTHTNAHCTIRSLMFAVFVFLYCHLKIHGIHLHVRDISRPSIDFG